MLLLLATVAVLQIRPDAFAESRFLAYTAQTKYFGTAAVYGDFDHLSGPLLVVGSPLENATTIGNVYAIHGPFVGGAPTSVVSLRGWAVPGEYGGLGQSLAIVPTYANGSPVLAVGAPRASGTEEYGNVILYQGSSEAIYPSPDITQMARVGHSVASCDFNGDGHTDLVVGTNQTTPGGGRVYIFLGGAGADGVADVVIEPNYSTGYFGQDVSGAGLLNPDSYEEVAIGHPYKGRAYVVFGRQVAQADLTPATITISESDDGTGFDGVVIDARNCPAVAGGVDITGDGSHDLVVTAGDPHLSFQWVRVYGGPWTAGGTPTVISEIRGGSSFGDALAVGGDVDGDGLSDLLIGCPGETPRGAGGANIGMVALLRGGTLPGSLMIDEVYETGPSRWFVSPVELPSWGEFGASVGFMADVDGDQRDEIFAGAPSSTLGQSNGAIYGFSLAPSDSITLTDLTETILAVPSGVDTEFRVAASHVGDQPLAVYMTSDDMGIAETLMTDNGDGTYSHHVTGLAVAAQTYAVEYFAVSAWGAGGGDGSFLLEEVQIEAIAADVWFKDGSDYTGELKSQMSGQPYSAVFFDTPDGSGSSHVFLMVTKDGDDVSELPQLYREVALLNGSPQMAFVGDEFFAASDAPNPGARGVTYADYDNDGDEDLFICNVDQPQLYENRLNEAEGKFVDVTPEVFSASSQSLLTGAHVAVWGDYNQDGWIDLYVSTLDYFGSADGILPLSMEIDGGGGGGSGGGSYAAGHMLFRNEYGRFVRTLGSMSSFAVPSWCASWNDVDGDGLTGARIVVNTGAGWVPGPALDAETEWNGTAVGDFDQDGEDDVLLLPILGQPQLCVRDTGGSDPYRRVGINSGLAEGKTSGVAVADFNGDGDLDLYLGRTNDKEFAYLNARPGSGDTETVGASQAWVGVELATLGTSNRSLIGARVHVSKDNPVAGQATDVWQAVDGGSGRGGQRRNRLHFGLGDYAGTVTIVVNWPSGGTKTLSNVAVNTDHTLIEDGFPTIVYGPSFSYEPYPGGADWVFTMTTDVKGDQQLDALEFINSQGYGPSDACYAGPSQVFAWDDQDADFEIVIEKVGSGWSHTFILKNRPCLPNLGCQFQFNIRYGLPGQLVQTGDVDFGTFSTCIPELPGF